MAVHNLTTMTEQELGALLRRLNAQTTIDAYTQVAAVVAEITRRQKAQRR